LQDLIPWDQTSPKIIKSFLNDDMSDFSVSDDLYIKKPLIALTCFRYIQMFGARSPKWIENEMRNWLTSLGSGGN
jgi:hypothetical protein